MVVVVEVQVQQLQAEEAVEVEDVVVVGNHHPDPLDRQAQQDLLEVMEHLEDLEIQDPTLKHPHHKNLMVEVVLQNAKLHSQEAQDPLAHQVPMDSLDLLEHLHQQAQDHLALLDRQDPMDNLEDLEKLDPLVHLDKSQKDHHKLAHPVLLDQMDSLEDLERLEPLEDQETLEGKVLLEIKDLLDRLEPQAQLDKMEGKDQMEDMELATIAHRQELRQDIKQKYMKRPKIAQFEGRIDFLKKYLIVYISFIMYQKFVKV